MNENYIKNNKIHNLIFEEIKINESKKHEFPENNFHHDGNLLKEFARDLRQSVNVSRKIIFGETVKNIVAKVEKNDEMKSNEDSILNFQIFKKKKAVNEIESVKVRKFKNQIKSSIAIQSFASELQNNQEDKKIS